MRKALARHVVHPIKDAVAGRNTLAVLASLRASESWSPDALRELQDRRLKRVIECAYEHVPYYAALFRELGIHPNDVRSRGDLAKIPVLTRASVRAHRGELLAQTRRGGYAQTVFTSGSTGEPLSFVCDASSMTYHLANRLRGRAWNGVDVGDPELRVWHDPRAYIGRGLASRAFWTINAIKDRLLNVDIVEAADLSEQSLSQWAHHIRRMRPALVYGYASALHRFACFLRARGPDCSDAGVRAVVVTAEKIGSPQKQMIAEALGAPVVEEYGSAECGVMAFGCPAGRLHSSDESVILEVSDGNDERGGPLLVTTLTNSAMPLIRYALGDFVSLSSEVCPCGRGLGVIREVDGRAADVLVNTRREHVHPFRLMLFLQRFPKIIRYKVIQHSIERVECLAQVTAELDESESSAILNALRDAIGEEVQPKLRIVDDLPPEPSGKHRFLVSLVDRDGEDPGTVDHA